MPKKDELTPEEFDKATKQFEAYLNKAPKDLITKLGKGLNSFDKIKGRVSLTVKGNQE